MSDAKTAAEIEDILSSIRRLVSQDRKAAAVAPRPQILSRLVVEDRLILTPAQRVTPERRPSATVTPLKRPQPVAESWPETAPEMVPETAAPAPLTLNLSAAPQTMGQRPLSPLPEAAPAAKPEPALAATTAAASAAKAETQLETTAEAPVLGTPVPETASEPSRLHLTADALAWESETGDAAPDLSSLDWSSFTFARRPMAETYAARSRAAERLTASAAPVAPVAAPQPVPEPVAELPPQPKIDLSAPEAEPVQPMLQEEDSIFSEDVLRELVRDLIREQLQGDLGERITRNIRKLIKAEIARTMSLQQLD